MTSLIALVSGFGWHVEDLLRAAGRLGVSLQAVPFPRVSAVVGAKDGRPARDAPASSI